ncbi:unnamed protein product [Phytophthora lilii]|uniref:Unnamed protein product n=1 Tax=Phytophthora lilii TaxID=2077276 RepID=A0A9W6U572_9STRA|nr:unnamed protein product [Phytophthora lilii]
MLAVLQYQIQALSPKYRLIVPDVRGFGQSSTPQELEAYGTKNTSRDLVVLLDALKIEKAVVVGHDWGGSLAWKFCLYHPERVLAVSGVCTPFVPPRKQYVSLEDMCKYVPQFKYQLFLADAKNSGKALDASPRRLATAIFRRKTEYGPKEEMLPLDEWLKAINTDLDHVMFTERSVMLSEDELQYYIDQYTQSGFTGANWVYATKKIDFETEKDLPGTIEHPALFIGAADDPVLKPEMAKSMPKVIPNLQMEVVEDAGHWVLLEQPQAVNHILSEWLTKVTKPSMASPQEAPLSPLVSATGVSTQRHVDAIYANPKHFDPESKHKAALSTGVTVEYAIHENKAKVDNAPEERVILIMGFMTIKEAWTPLIDMLLHKWDDAVDHKRNVKLVSFDNRGIGGSDVPWWRYTTSGMAQDALALMDFLEWESAHVVGISMGGMISQELALAAPQRVKSLTLMVTTRGKFVDDPRSKEPMKESLNAKDPVDIANSQLKLLFSDVYLDQAMAFGDKKRRDVMYEYLEDRAKVRVKPRFHGMINQLLAVRTHWISDERLAAINDAGFPILLIGSAMDILIPPREMQTLREHLKGDHVQTLFFEHGGHGVIIQYPEEIADGLTTLILRC